jgi:hypothetical protein
MNRLFYFDFADLSTRRGAYKLLDGVSQSCKEAPKLYQKSNNK